MARAIIKEVPYLRVYDDGTFLIRDIRVSYPHFDAPWANKPTDTPKHSGVGLLDKTKHKQAKRVLDEMINEIVKSLKLKAMAEKDKCLRDGDASAKDENAGCWTLNVSSSADRQPSVRGKDTRPIPQNKIKSTILPGYEVDMLGKLWPQNNEHGKKVNCELIAVQFKRENETFGQDRISEDDIDDTFEAADDDESDSGFDDGQDDDEDPL